jgi:hypothetical protein
MALTVNPPSDGHWLLALPSSLTRLEVPFKRQQAGGYRVGFGCDEGDESPPSAAATQPGE